MPILQPYPCRRVLVTVNVTEWAHLDCLRNNWAVEGWWVGWIGERIVVVPLADSQIHISPGCRCQPQAAIANGKSMLVHNAFDGREGKPS